jgi:hypothetical protein
VGTYDNRFISWEQREGEAARNSRGTKTVSSRNAYDDCMLRAENVCGTPIFPDRQRCPPRRVAAGVLIFVGVIS